MVREDISSSEGGTGEIMKTKFLLVLGLIFTPLWAGWVSREAQVIEVVDGDTIRVTFDKKQPVTVRLLYIDTFETSRNTKMKSDIKKLRSEGFAVSEKQLLEKGLEAKRYLLKRLPPRSIVRLEWDDMAANDRYGRLLALVFVSPGEVCINEELVRLGYARPYILRKIPPAHRQFIERAYQQALREGRWGWMEKSRGR